MNQKRGFRATQPQISLDVVSTRVHGVLKSMSPKITSLDHNAESVAHELLSKAETNLLQLMSEQ